MTADERLAQKAYELDIDYPKNLPALVSVRRVGNLLFTSGSGCGTFRQGLIGSDLTFEDGYLACQHIAMIQLGMIKQYLGDLDKVDQILRVYGHLAVADDFHDLDKVADGLTDVLGAVFGDRGRAPRTILGTRNLPVGNTAAELELILSVKD
jgi:enamine deaminase RidA (YjgF/YER057c/UK114 family)